MSIPSANPTPGTRPVAVVVISLVLVLEALALLGAAAWFVYGLMTQTPLSMGGAIFQLVLLLLLSGWLLAAAHFFFRGYRWTRAAALVWQLFVIVIAFPTFTSGLVLPGLLLLLPAAVVLLLIFTRPVTDYLTKGSAPGAV
ncbi:hypothetical protein [Arthrobacter mangrovi]|uniref:Integral membrane protein n=1 Tax=Arthrobacter mangrovi TaxID=2966350 RepID=A0ABQ5MSE8_9MICC|nr:hypothetical protein [Arthrobacter mangrovi]GLB66903.1 hypothetical protein AHIS1636_13420 [Arthrobacter mangrovi]